MDQTAGITVCAAGKAKDENRSRRVRKPITVRIQSMFNRFNASRTFAEEAALINHPKFQLLRDLKQETSVVKKAEVIKEISETDWGIARRLVVQELLALLRENNHLLTMHVIYALGDLKDTSAIKAIEGVCTNHYLADEYAKDFALEQIRTANPLHNHGIFGFFFKQRNHL